MLCYACAIWCQIGFQYSLKSLEILKTFLLLHRLSDCKQIVIFFLEIWWQNSKLWARIENKIWRKCWAGTKYFSLRTKFTRIRNKIRTTTRSKFKLWKFFFLTYNPKFSLILVTYFTSRVGNLYECLYHYSKYQTSTLGSIVADWS